MLEVLGAEPTASFQSVLPLMDHARLAEHLEVVGEAGFGAVEAEPATGVIELVGLQEEFARHRHTERIGEGAHHGLESEFVDGWFRQERRSLDIGCGLWHIAILAGLYENSRTATFPVRIFSYKEDGP